jgi:4-hydroxy-3-methylbut-2-enyl diphosphate reductase
LIIVGSKNSSNSNKLKEIWEKLWIKSILIDSYKEIENSNILTTEYFNPLSLKIWISSWASAPEILVTELLEYLKKIWETEIIKIKTVDEKMIFDSNIKIN